MSTRIISTRKNRVSTMSHAQKYSTQDSDPLWLRSQNRCGCSHRCFLVLVVVQSPLFFSWISNGLNFEPPLVPIRRDVFPLSFHLVKVALEGRGRCNAHGALPNSVFLPLEKRFKTQVQYKYLGLLLFFWVLFSVKGLCDSRSYSTPVQKKHG